jgi:DHA1 family inner membrane transport protein
MTQVNATGKSTFSARAILLIELALAMGGFAIGTGESPSWG